MCVCPQYQKLAGWSIRRRMSCPPSLSPYLSPFRSFNFYFLCVSVNGVKNQSLFLTQKQYSLKSKEDWRITFAVQWGNKFSQLVCFILLRLTSMWALYTLKWTLVTLVLMGHYLTYEFLRHNQLYFTCKDHLWWPPSSPTLSLLTYLLELADNHRAAEQSPRFCVTSLHPSHCHIRTS